MKRLLLLLLVMAIFIITPSLASNNLQNPTDAGELAFANKSLLAGYGSDHTHSWVESGTGGNNYEHIETDPYNIEAVCNKYPSQTNYSAATTFGTNILDSTRRHGALLYDASGNYLAGGSISGLTLGEYRLEAKINESLYLKFYGNGALLPTGISATVAQFPSFVCWGLWNNAGGPLNSDFDEFTHGSPLYVLSLPENYDEKFVIYDDLSNPLGGGIAYGDNNTVIDSNWLYGRFARGSYDVPPVALTNDSVDLIYYLTAGMYSSNYTGTAYTGASGYNIRTALLDTDAPDGLYALHTQSATAVYSNFIVKRHGGATISFDRERYSVGDTAIATYDISSIDTGAYTYTIEIMDIYGTIKASKSETVAIGTLEYPFVAADTPGAYYVAVIATSKTTGIEYWIGSDIAELTVYATLIGTVMDENGSPLSGASYNISQGSVIVSDTTLADGTYNASGYSPSQVLMNFTMDGHDQYYKTIQLLKTGTIAINVTLPSSSLSYSGLGIYGVARDGEVSGSDIANGYGRPIPGATVRVVNLSTAESYNRTTNIAGFYMCDNGALCYLVNNRVYDVNGTKTGYFPSPIYNVTATGSL